MPESVPHGKLRKYGWIIYLAIIILLLAYLYTDIKSTPAPGVGDLNSNPVWENEDITPVANLSCFECHGGVNGTGGQGITIPGVDWFTSTHKEVGTTCTDCHGGDSTNTTDPMGSEGFIGKPEREAIPGICGNCHVEIYEEYKTSIHYSYVWKEELNRTSLASVCTDCHGVHHIERANNPESPIYFQNRPETCGKCHETSLYSFEDTYHGAYIQLGSEAVATCSDCHGNHGNLPPSDPNSTVHIDNLPETCSKCHGNELDMEITRGYLHNEGELGESEEAYHIIGFDLRVIIPTVYKLAIIGMVLGIVLLIILENVGRPIGKKVSTWRKKKNT